MDHRCLEHLLDLSQKYRWVPEFVNARLAYKPSIFSSNDTRYLVPFDMAYSAKLCLVHKKVGSLSTYSWDVLHLSCAGSPRGLCTPKDGMFHFISRNLAVRTLCSEKMGFAISLGSVLHRSNVLALSTLCLCTKKWVVPFHYFVFCKNSFSLFLGKTLNSFNLPCLRPCIEPSALSRGRVYRALYPFLWQPTMGEKQPHTDLGFWIQWNLESDYQIWSWRLSAKKERSVNSSEIRDRAVPGNFAVYQVFNRVYLFSIYCVKQCSIEETLQFLALFWDVWHVQSPGAGTVWSHCLQPCFESIHYSLHFKVIAFRNVGS